MSQPSEFIFKLDVSIVSTRVFPESLPRSRVFFRFGMMGWHVEDSTQGEVSILDTGYVVREGELRVYIELHLVAMF